MVEVAPPRPLREDDDRASLDCGRESMNNWFRRHAWHNQLTGVTRTNVVCDTQKGAITGYVTLSAAQIERTALASPHQRNAPDPVAVTLLGQLAIAKSYHGQGHGRSLLLFALKTAYVASRQIGSFGVITHPLDERARDYYRRWGFEDTPYDARRSMIIRMIDLEKNGIV